MYITLLILSLIFNGPEPIATPAVYYDRNDLLRFPDRNFCGIQMRINRQHREWLCASYRFDCRNREYWGSRIIENDRLYEVWFRLDDAWYYENHPNFGWNTLEHLESLLGEKSYRDGRMPPAVAIWSFSR